MKRKALSLLLVLAMVLTLLPMAAFAEVNVGDLGEGSYNQILSKTEYGVAPGITETDIVINNKQLTEQNMGYVMEIDMTNPNVHVVAGYKDYQGETWGMQTVRDQAAKAEAVLKQTAGFGADTKIVGAINANFFNMATGEPLGPLVMNGKICHNIDNNHEYGYFAVFKDGHAEILRDDVPIPANVVEAMGGANMLLEDGNICASAMDGHAQGSRNPRSAVGIKADGTVVLYEVDGRQAPMSVGMTCNEMAEILKGMGCVDAVLLDGGGSSTFCTRREGSDTLEVQNSLSDGNERTVSGTILIASTAAADGEFARAAVTPRGKYYTPGSQIQFNAKGVDAAGYKADLPQGLVWALADDAAGTIDANGLFTAAADFTGEVLVQLKLGARVVGSATVQIQKPDKLEFANDGLNLKYNEVKDLGLSAKYQGNEIIYKVGDIVWDISVETISIGKNGETEDVASGYMDGNTFIANPNNALGNRSVESTVTAKSAFDESITDTMTVGIGKEPVVVMDGGDNDGHDYSNIGIAHAAPSGGGVEYETHLDDHGDVILVHYVGRTLRGYCGSTAEQVDIDNGMVRFGEKAIKVNYDFTDITGTEGACLGFDHDITIDGNPTGIGCWVYAPEGTPNLWFRIRVMDGTGTVQTLDFTNEGKAASDPTNPKYDGTMGGVNWTGWKYIECQFDTSEAGTQLVGPFTLMAGETIRIMAVPNSAITQNEMGTWVCQMDAQGNVPEPKYIGWGNSKGCFYVDNLQLVYGANPADIDNPYIKTLRLGTDLGNAVEAASDGSTVIDSNTMMVYTEFGDVINENTTGVEIARVYIDGVNLTDKAVISIPDGKMTLDGITMANGEHTVEVLVRDFYGNEATLTRSFQVQQEDSTLTAIQLTAEEDFAPLGGDYVVSLGSNNLADVKSVNMSLSVGEQAEDIDVSFSEAYEGTAVFENGTLTLNAEKKDGVEAENIATLTFKIRYDLPELSTVQYTYSGSLEYVDPQEGVLNTFAGTSKLIPVEAAYSIEVSKTVVDGDPCVITIKDKNGRPVKGVEVYTGYEGQLIGTTKSNGKLSTYIFSDAAQNVAPYAIGPDGYSFALKTMSYSAAYNDALPHAIQLNSTVNSATGQNISWLTNPLLTNNRAVMLYATKAAYDAQGESAFITVEGKVMPTYFEGDKVTANANGVVVTGLSPDTAYVYKVGDGKNWSELRSFKTEKAGQDTTNFFIITDTQLGGYGESEYVRMDAANAKLGELADNYTFGIHLGDAVETANVFAEWDTYFKHFNTGVFDKTDIIHVIGNHEDATADVGENIYNTNHKGYYSVDNGCVYVAVIDFTVERAKLTEAMEWLKADASASSAPWKFVATHVPVYYTNVTSKEILYKELLAPVCDELGIDAVFSGHDHAYARTYPLVAGNVDETLDNWDNGDGTVYYVCGTLGGKYYGGVDTPEFHFKTVRSGSRDSEGNQNLDPCAVFLTVNADKNKFTVSAYDYFGNLIDQFSRTRKDACDDGHDFEYDVTAKTLTCKTCGIVTDTTATPYTGMVSVGEKNMFLENGTPKTGWIAYGEAMVHAGADGFLHETETVNTATCMKNGHWTSTCKECDVDPYVGEATWAKGHTWDENHVCTVCGTEGIDIAGVTYTIGKAYTYTGKAVKPNATLTYNGKTLNTASDRTGIDGYTSYTNNVNVGVGTVTYEGRGDFYGKLELNFAIVPGKITDFKVSNVTDTGAALSWTAAPGATKYVVEKLGADGKWAVVGETEDTGFVLEKLPCGELSYRVAWTVSIGGSTYSTGASSRPVVTFTSHDHSYKETKVTAPTCTEKGYTTFTCELCGDSYNGSETAALGHSYKDVVTAPTCTEKGYTTHTCERCGDSYKDSETAALGHNYVDSKCTRCGDLGPTFTDIQDLVKDFQEAIIWVYKSGITAGITKTEFAPNKACTRGQVVTFLWRAAGEPEPETTENPFKDVNEKDYYYDAILWASENEIVFGYDDGTFRPNATVTRAQFVTFLWRYSDSPKPESEESPFSDVDEQNRFYEAILWASENGVVSGYDDGTFRPDNVCTRAHVATFLYRALADVK